MSAKTIDMPDISADQRIALQSPMELLIGALQKADAGQLAQLLDVKLRLEASEARKAYYAALHAFKANPPDINKTHEVKYVNKDGSLTRYHHSELDVINDIIQPALQVHGLAATWRPTDSNGRIVMVCVLSHKLGHSEDIATLSGPADTSGGKNNIQGIGSTASYLRRYTVECGLGLVAKGVDDDGRSSERLQENAVEDFLVSIRDAATVEELRYRYEQAKQSATAKQDLESIKQFVAAKDTRYRELKAAQ